MRRSLQIRTTKESVYIDGHFLFDDLTDMLHAMLGKNSTRKAVLYSEPIQNSIKAVKIGNIGNTTQYRSKDGVFTICNSFVKMLNLDKQFYYKIYNDES
jgi:hypothetical protein